MKSINITKTTSEISLENPMHGEWAATTKGEFATASQVWQRVKRDFYYMQFVAENEKQVYKKIEVWSMSKLFSLIVF